MKKNSMQDTLNGSPPNLGLAATTRTRNASKCCIEHVAQHLSNRCSCCADLSSDALLLLLLALHFHKPRAEVDPTNNLAALAAPAHLASSDDVPASRWRQLNSATAPQLVRRAAAVWL
jgi:hypothetical protein